MSATNLVVEPGGQASCSVVVRNSGVVVDQFMIDVVGDAAGWAVVEPASVNLMPGESATAVVRFAPPKTAQVKAGPVAFGVRVFSREDPNGSVVDEGLIEVAPFTDVAAELVPAKAEGARRAAFEVAIDNSGNHPVEAEIIATEPEDKLLFRVDRPTLTVQPGTTVFVGLQSRPKKRFLRGRNQSHPFQVLVVVAGLKEPVAAPGTMVQKQTLPKWLLPALLALLALAVVLVTLWFTVLRPAVASAAREAVAQETNELKESAKQAKADAAQAKQDSAKAKEGSNKAMQAAGLDPNDPGAVPNPANPRPNQPPPAPASEPTDFRIAGDAPISAEDKFKDFTFEPPADKTLVVTDLVLQNPRGDSGMLRVMRQASGGEKTVLLEVGLNNFRDLDHHWLQPWRFKAGEKVVFAVSCQNPADRGNCKPAASFSGRVEG